jgi:hypothetical protein
MTDQHIHHQKRTKAMTNQAKKTDLSIQIEVVDADAFYRTLNKMLDEFNEAGLPNLGDRYAALLKHVMSDHPERKDIAAAVWAIISLPFPGLRYQMVGVNSEIAGNPPRSVPLPEHEGTVNYVALKEEELPNIRMALELAEKCNSPFVNINGTSIPVDILRQAIDHFEADNAKTRH